MCKNLNIISVLCFRFDSFLSFNLTLGNLIMKKQSRLLIPSVVASLVTLSLNTPTFAESNPCAPKAKAQHQHDMKNPCAGKNPDATKSPYEAKNP